MKKKGKKQKLNIKMRIRERRRMGIRIGIGMEERNLNDKMYLKITFFERTQFIISLQCVGWGQKAPQVL